MTRVAVIGGGSMGRNHLRVLRDLAGVVLVAVADSDAPNAESLGRAYGIPHYTSHQELLASERVDAVTIAAPTTLHHPIAIDALAAGCHVLVEKPLAATVDEAEDLVKRAKAAGRILAAGHVERHNPAIRELKRRLKEGQAGRIYQLHTRRLGPFPERVRDVGVTLDLATHDVDVMRYLMESEVTRVFAETRREVHASREDIASALLSFAGGAIGLLDVSWLTPTKIRDVTVTGERGLFRAEYLTQDLYFYENAHAADSQWDHLQILRGVSEGAMTRYPIDRQEPLKLELQAFVAAVGGKGAEIVTGEDGVAALRLAHAILTSGTEMRPMDLLGGISSR
ncbi:Gfo/Idh/MocA family oxidoreductase [bacterium]|nr:MAG: Gfo/Idh/MocA family oxidoreductase [bacterium]